MDKEFEPLTVEQFGLSPAEMKIFVAGAQKYFGPSQTEPEPDAIVPADIEPNADHRNAR